jgi:hypothetical protein
LSFLIHHYSLQPFNPSISFHFSTSSRVGAIQPTDRNNLAAPLSNRLYFAGEHTSALYPATVHGAYLSGIAAASAILSAPTVAPTSSPTITVTIATPLSTTVFVTQTVNTGQSLAEMQYASFATAFANGMQNAIPGTTVVVTGVTAATRRFLLAAAAVSYTASSTTLSAATIQTGIVSPAATSAVASFLGTAGFSGVTLSTPVFTTPAPSSAPVQSNKLSQVHVAVASPYWVMCIAFDSIKTVTFVVITIHTFAPVFILHSRYFYS